METSSFISSSWEDIFTTAESAVLCHAVFRPRSVSHFTHTSLISSLKREGTFTSISFSPKKNLLKKREEKKQKKNTDQQVNFIVEPSNQHSIPDTASAKNDKFKGFTCTPAGFCWARHCALSERTNRSCSDLPGLCRTVKFYGFTEQNLHKSSDSDYKRVCFLTSILQSSEWSRSKSI